MAWINGVTLGIEKRSRVITPEEKEHPLSSFPGHADLGLQRSIISNSTISLGLLAFWHAQRLT